ncbi:MAG: class I SAM-dependent methyltransferase [Gammaproteobacteria bacterium]|nr:class I SAM-dependent methyltransferase [Gammaproteobacteria bacterium]
MKTEWNYTELAEAYLKRPDYADSAIDQLFQLAGLKAANTACDVGAGVAHLTLHLLKRGLKVTAVEPNDAMRERGIRRTSGQNVQWFEGVGEDTRQAPASFDIVTFGSSFNVCDRPKALLEVKRISKAKGWFAAMWNHRDLQDPIQARIEQIITEMVPSYGYGVRREDQTEVMNASGLFEQVHFIEGSVVHQQTVAEVVEAWRSHATLQRQAEDRFNDVVAAIEQFLISAGQSTISIPYTTRIWCGQLRG